MVGRECFETMSFGGGPRRHGTYFQSLFAGIFSRCAIIGSTALLVCEPKVAQ